MSRIDTCTECRVVNNEHEAFVRLCAKHAPGPPPDPRDAELARLRAEVERLTVERDEARRERDEMLAQCMSMTRAPDDAAAIVAAVNALPALLRVARAAEAYERAFVAADRSWREFKDGADYSVYRDTNQLVHERRKEFFAAVRAMREVR